MPPPTQSRTLVLIIGVTDYPDAKYAIPGLEDRLFQLNANLIQSRFVQPEHISLLTGAEATRSNILQLIKQFGKVVTETDNLLIFWAGCSFSLFGKGQYSKLATADSTSDQIVETGIIPGILTRHLHKIKARNLLLVIDTAYPFADLPADSSWRPKPCYLLDFRRLNANLIGFYTDKSLEIESSLLSSFIYFFAQERPDHQDVFSGYFEEMFKFWLARQSPTSIDQVAFFLRFVDLPAQQSKDASDPKRSDATRSKNIDKLLDSGEEEAKEESGKRQATFSIFAEKANRRGQEITSEYCLRQGQWYQLEVAIRTRGTGIKYSATPEAIPEKEQSENIRLLVVLEGAGVKVEHPTAEIILPPEGNSIEQAIFRIQPEKASASELDLAQLSVSIYHRFNLIETGVIEMEIARKFPPRHRGSRFGLEFPTIYHQDASYRSFYELEANMIRHMHIHVQRKYDQFHLRFVLQNELDQEVTLMGTTQLSMGDLQHEISVLRSEIGKIAAKEVFKEKINPKQANLQADVKGLATIGYKLWTYLFGNASRSLYHIGQWLKEHPLANDSLIQVSIDQAASGFIFPWSFLYDKEIPAFGGVDHAPFWGLRYHIEQQFQASFPQSDQPLVTDEKLDVGLIVNTEFSNTQAQIEAIQALVQQGEGKIQMSHPPADSKREGLTILDDPAQDIFYFYTHGHTASLSLEPDYEADDSSDQRNWIQLKSGRIGPEDLYAGEPWKQSPLVILNMCESAELTPFLSNDLVRSFLARGAGAVLGTECPMTIVFAHPFGTFVLEEVLKGTSIGAALLAARRKFVEQNNILGLAYTLYGSASLQFNPPLIKNKQS